ncbi:Uncharacterised protein [Vibrio cholerae]|nr:Uncharacterised protein [Vibrio cholerae]CSA29360.1 Uncharacterised protein [Vibrio cholerae]
MSRRVALHTEIKAEHFPTHFGVSCTECALGHFAVEHRQIISATDNIANAVYAKMDRIRRL